MIRTAGDKLAERVSVWNRTRKAAFVRDFVRTHAIRSVLFVGVGEGHAPRWMIVEDEAAAVADRVVACDLFERSRVPWAYVRADGLALPFRAGAFDLVLSNAVIEHVGGDREQRRFVEEHARVGRHWIITTPNRWFPVETHTLVPLLHWSARWRSRQEEFTRLLSRREFERLLPAESHIEGPPYDLTFIGASASP